MISTLAVGCVLLAFLVGFYRRQAQLLRQALAAQRRVNFQCERPLGMNAMQAALEADKAASAAGFKPLQG